jgi:hypothetical protein
MLFLCLSGLYVSKLILGSESENHGVNKINTRTALLGNMDGFELENLIKQKMNIFDFRVTRIFNKID